RRRHTRSKRDWSSDVCSSDLMALYGYTISTISKVTCSLRALGATPKERGNSILPTGKVPLPPKPYNGLSEGLSRLWLIPMRSKEIGRASCRERGEGRSSESER